MVDLQHIAEVIAIGAVNVIVAVKVLNARFDALHEKVNLIEQDVTRAHTRIDSIILIKGR